MDINISKLVGILSIMKSRTLKMTTNVRGIALNTSIKISLSLEIDKNITISGSR